MILIYANSGKVLHAANGIQNSLVQCRKLLKPQGRIVLLEMTNRENLVEPYIFGLLPGLSRSPEAAKNDSPLLNAPEWGDMLLETGFSGLDTYISDSGFITEEEISAIMISTAAVPPSMEKADIHLICDFSVPNQVYLAQSLGKALTEREGMRVVHVLWHTMAGQDHPQSIRPMMEHNLVQSICVFLPGWDGSFLGRLNEDDHEKLKTIVSSAKALIWPTAHNDAKYENPTEGLVPGLARTLATESEDCRVISVILDARSDPSTAAGKIVKVTEAFLQSHGVPEDEYFSRDNLLHVPRVIKDYDMAANIFSPEQTVTERWSVGRARFDCRHSGSSEYATFRAGNSVHRNAQSG